MVSPLALAVDDAKVLVGLETGDDAGVYLHEGHALVATADFITPVCDDPRRFGRVAAANSVSDVYAMGGQPLFALNLCCFPKSVPQEALTEILQGGLDVLREAGAALIGGHTVQDKELKYGMSVVGRADPDRLLTNAKARPGDRLVLSKPLGTGAVINGFRAEKLDETQLETALCEMERLNAVASRLAVERGARACTDVTGFGLVGHALVVARASNVAIRFRFEDIPAFDAFYEAASQGVSTRATSENRGSAESEFEAQADLNEKQLELLFDPQTSGGLLVTAAPEDARALLEDLKNSGHQAADIGEVLSGPARVTIV